MTRYPYGKEKSAIDHAIPMVDLFPMMNQLRSEEESFFELCKPGIELVSDTIDSRLKKECLAVDGFDKVCKALELAEFGLLKEVRYLSLSACNNGCIGGQFLWGNSFNGKINMRELIKTAHQPMYECSFDELYSEETADAIDAMPNIFEQLNRFKNVNEKLEALPGFDCGACGYPSCRTMAEAITDGICTLQQCRVLERQVKK